MSTLADATKTATRLPVAGNLIGVGELVSISD